MQKKPISFIRKDTHVTICLNDGTPPYTVYNTDLEKFKKTVIAYHTRDFKTLKSIINPSKAITDAGKGRIVVENGVVKYDGQAMHNTLTDRIVEMVEQGHDVNPMIKFMDNLMDNPSKRAVDELFGFLDEGKLPITGDGHFLAYKKVLDNFHDCHTGTIDNSPGQIVKMARNQVDDNKRNTCSDGLHFCARSYLSSFGGARTVMVKINPRDVVSIPTDYNNAKGRCCEYLVIRELVGDEGLEGALNLEEAIEEVTKPDAFDTKEFNVE